MSKMGCPWLQDYILIDRHERFRSRRERETNKVKSNDRDDGKGGDTKRLRSARSKARRNHFLGFDRVSRFDHGLACYKLTTIVRRWGVSSRSKRAERIERQDPCGAFRSRGVNVGWRGVCEL
jgi:hypothetical protein